MTKIMIFVSNLNSPKGKDISNESDAQEHPFRSRAGWPFYQMAQHIVLAQAVCLRKGHQNMSRGQTALNAKRVTFFFLSDHFFF